MGTISNRLVVLCAALCMMLGTDHTHKVFEKIFWYKPYEQITIDIILSEETEVNQILCKVSFISLSHTRSSQRDSKTHPTQVVQLISESNDATVWADSLASWRLFHRGELRNFRPHAYPSCDSPVRIKLGGALFLPYQECTRVEDRYIVESFIKCTCSGWPSTQFLVDGSRVKSFIKRACCFSPLRIELH